MHRQKMDLAALERLEQRRRWRIRQMRDRIAAEQVSTKRWTKMLARLALEKAYLVAVEVLTMRVRHSTCDWAAVEQYFRPL